MTFSRRPIAHPDASRVVGSLRGLLVIGVVLVFGASPGLAAQRSTPRLPQSATQPSSSVVDPAVQVRARALTHEIRALATQLRKAPHARRTRLSRKLVTLSRDRWSVLGDLLRDDPQAVDRLVLPRRDRLALGRLRGARVERGVARQGWFRTLHSDDFGDPSRSTYLDQLVTSSGHSFTLLPSNSKIGVRLTFARLKSGARLGVHGWKFAGRVLVTKMWKPRKGRTFIGDSTTVGSVGVAVIAGSFTDSTTPVDMSAIEGVFHGNPGHDAVSYFSEASYGKMTLSPSFFGPYTLPTSTAAGCSGSDTTQALMNAANADVDFTHFRRLVFVLNCPQTVGLSSSEGPVATPDGTITAATTLLDPTSATIPYVVIHEISHTLGSGNKHASFFVCDPSSFTPPARFDNECASSEYDDAFDVLGGGPSRHTSELDPYHKANAGWFGPGQFPTVSGAGTYTYTLAPYEQGSGSVLALNIPRGQTGSSFTVEYRQPIDFDSWMSSCSNCTVTQGASLRLAGAPVSGYSGGGDTQLIDTTPGSLPSSYYYPFDDALDGALTPGHTFTDPEYGISITTVSADSSGLTVQVTIPPQTCTHASPTMGAVSPSSQSAGVGQTAVYSFTLTNNDSAGCPDNTFRYFAPGTPGLNFTATPDYLKLAPGASATISLAISAQPTATAGSYGFSTIDGRGGGFVYSNSLGTSSAVAAGFSFVLSAPADTTAPSAPSGLTAQALGSQTVKLSWNAATDNLGVAGYQVTSSSGSMYTTSDLGLVDPSVIAGSSTSYTVRAFDRRGNFSPAATVGVSTPARTDYSGPTAPVVTATAGDHSLTVSWTASRDNVGVAYYRISPCFVPNCVVPANVRSFTVGGLPTRTRYDLQVMAYDGDGSYSNPCCGAYTVYTAAAGTSAPSQPIRFVSTAGKFHEVDLSWAASTDDSGVAGYDVFRNNRKIGTTTSTSFTDLEAGGSAQYYVQAVDSDGSLSAPSMRAWFLPPTSVSSDSSSPTASINAPADGATVSGTVNVSASASDDIGVTKAELYVDGVLRSTTTSAPYAFSWDTTTLGDGPHWLYVLAYDAAGNYGAAGGTMVTVHNVSGDTTPPTVEISSPAAGATVSGTVQVLTSATDNVGVTRVELDVDGSLAGSNAGGPFGFALDTTAIADGSHVLTAKAYDAAGNSSTAGVVVTVQNSSPPAPPGPPDTVPPKAPSSLRAAIAGTSQLALYWTASTDNVGVVAYEIWRDGAKVAETSLPNFLDSGLVPGTSHKYQVVARDAAGNRSLASSALNGKTVSLSTAKTGTLAGVVYDAAGKPLSNVVVTLSGNGITKTAKTGASGYKFSSLPVGTYTVTIGAAAPVQAAVVAGQTILLAS